MPHLLPPFRLRTPPGHHQRPVVEALEERILHSADLSPLGLAAGDAHTMAVLPAVHIPQAQRTEIVFVDLAVPQADAVLADLQARRAAGAPIEVVTIDAQEDGLARISATLAGRSGIGALQVISHGSDGALQLGNTLLDNQALFARAGELAQWGQALAQDADVLLYGCDLAASTAGRDLVASLAALTGADVAASVDATGSAARGGNWNLELSTGVIEAGPALSVGFQQAWGGLLLTSTGELQVNATVPNIQDTSSESRGSQQAVAIDASGAYVVVWTSTNQGGAGEDVYARRFDATGAPISGEILVNSTSDGDHRSAGVVSDAAGNFVVTWTGRDPAGTEDRVFVRRFDASGLALTAQTLVSTTATGDQSNAVIAMRATTGDFVVAWQGEGPGDAAGIFFRRFQADGTALDATERLANLADAGTEVNPSVAMDASGNFVVVWERADHVYFQRFDASGAALAGRVQVDTVFSNSSGPVVAMDSTGKFTVLYHEQNAVAALTGIWGRQFDANGSASGFFFQVASGGENPSLQMGEDGHFLVAYNQKIDLVDRILVSRRSSGGAAADSALVVSQSENGLRANASLALIDSRNYVVVWSGGSAQDAQGVIARQIASTPPEITSNGGDAVAVIDVLENTTAVTTVTAVDTDLPAQTLSYSISGGADAALFTIHGTSGVLRFLQAPDFDMPADADADNQYAVTVRVSDGSYSDSQDITVRVGNVNEAPTGASTTISLFEDGSHIFSAADFGFSDMADTPANTLAAVRVPTVPQAGSLILGGVAVVAGQSIAVADILAGQLVFIPAANAQGASYAAFTFQVQDDGGTANGGVDRDTIARTLTLDVLAVNDAPVLSGANPLNPILEDATGGSGTQVSALVGGQVSDGDGAAAVGIAVTGVDNSNGTWQYTRNGGAVWSDFGAPTTASARLLAADSGTAVRFVPNANFHGSLPGALTLRAWDASTGVAGGVADTTVHGGSSAFSSATASTGITVLAVNDAPAGADRTVALAEDGSYTFGVADFGFSDAADSPANSLLAVQIGQLPASGGLTNNGIAVSAGQTLAAADILAGQLVYRPAADALGAALASFTFRVQDDGGTANGAIDLDPLARTMTLDVAAVNDAPVLTMPASAATNFNTPLVLSTALGTRLAVSDVDAGTATVELSLVSTHGILTLASQAGLVFVSGGDPGNAMRFTGTVTALNQALDGMLFTPTTGFDGLASISLQVNDQGQSGAGGALSDSGTLAVTVRPATPLLMADDTALVGQDAPLEAPSVLVNDTDPALGSLSVTAVNGVPAAVDATVALPSGALLTVRADGSFRYDPNNSFAGLAQGATVVDSFSYDVVSTAGGTGSATVRVTVQGANDAPVLLGANGLLPILEDASTHGGTLVSALVGGQISDADAGALAGIAVTAVDNSQGDWQYRADAGAAWTSFGTPQEASARLLAADAGAAVRFVPQPNFNGTVAAGITLRAWDRSSGVAGGTADARVQGGNSAFSSGLASAGVVVGPVNDAPAGADRTLSLPEHASHVFSASDFGFSDAADSPANALAAVRITTLPLAGSFTNNGIAVSAGQEIPLADILAGRLVFSIPEHANGAAYATVGFQVRDDGGTADGGSDLSAASATITIDVLSVNDEPTGTSSTITLQEDGAHVFGVADFGFADPHDSPANQLTAVRISSLPSAGNLTLSGAAVVAGQSIPVADILAGRLVFAPLADAAGAPYAQISFQVQDDGGTSLGGIDLDPVPDRLTLNVLPVNDAPVLAGVRDLDTILEDAVGNEGTLVAALVAGRVSDVDSLAPAGIAVTAVDTGHGTWQYTTNAGALWRNFGSPDAASARLLAADANTAVRFVPHADFNGTVVGGLTLRAWDGSSGVAGGTADTTSHGGASAFSSAQASAGITVVAVNDAPAGADGSITLVEDGSVTLALANFGFSDSTDTPAHYFAAVRIEALPPSGNLTLGGLPVVAGQTIAAADILAGGLVYRPLADASGMALDSIGFRVQDSGGTAGGGVDLDAVTRQLTVHVAPVNDLPVLATPVADQSATEDTPFVLVLAPAMFSDAEPGVLTLAATRSSGAALPSWLAFDAPTRTFAGTPLNADVGQFTVRVLGRDADGATASDEFVLTVANTNDAPVLAAALPDRLLTTGETVRFQLPPASFSDVDAGDTLTYSATLPDGSPLPDWLVFDGATATFTGTPRTSELGVTVVRVLATDASGAQAQGLFAIQVGLPAVEEAVVVEPASEPAPAVSRLPVVEPTNEEEDTVEADSAEASGAGAGDEAPQAGVPEAEPIAAVFAGGAVPDITVTVSTASLRTATETAVASAVARIPGGGDALFAELATPSTPGFSSTPAAQMTQLLASDELLRKFQEVQRQMQAQGELERVFVGSSVVVSGGLSVGYVVWLLRGGILMSSMLSALPAWQMIDPMPVLAAARTAKERGRKAGKPEDPEVERLFDRGERAP